MRRLIRAVVLTSDGAFASTITGPTEILRFTGVADRALAGARGRPRFRVTVASPDGAPVVCTGGLTVSVDTALADIGPADLIYLTSVGFAGTSELAAPEPVLAALRAAHAGGAVLAGVCSGVYLLARAGLLDGRRATTHWALAARFRETFPAVDLRPGQMITDDGNIVCAGGINAADDLALYLVERFCGRDEARILADSLVLDLPRASQSGYARWILSEDHGDAAVLEVQRRIAAAPEAPWSVETLALQAALSPRTLARRFRAATGETVVECIQRLRVARARELLETERLPVETVARRVGYEDVAFFRRLFRKHAGQTPSRYRQRGARGLEAAESAT